MSSTNQEDRNWNVNMQNQYLFQFGNCQSSPPVQKRPVGVFWDIENCRIPKGTSAHGLVQNIRTLFQQLHMLEREFVVVCDVYGVNKANINELNEMQVDVIHVSSYAKNASDEKLKQLMYRFIMIHGQNCAIILISSDINFAPILSDIKNRFGILVILFHRRQVSSALVACAHLHFDYDDFCSRVQGINMSSNENYITTYLAISNWEQEMGEEKVKNFLTRVTTNSGARELSVDYQSRQAIYMFKCKSDAQRCQQRIHDRRWTGNTLKAQIIANPNDPRITNGPTRNIPSLLNNQSSIQSVDSSQPVNRSQVICPPQSQSQPSTEFKNDAKGSSMFRKLRANRCEMCNQISAHSYHLFKQDILSVHISLDDLAKKINRLIELHPANKLPLNSLPNCWLAAFGQELDTKTEPKVMLEHLLACLDDICIEHLDVDVDGENISAKFITKSSIKLRTKLKKQKRRKLSQLSTQIVNLLISNMPYSFTSFPSILLSKLEAKYEAQFNEPLSYQQYGASSLKELIQSQLYERLNLYTYDDDFLVALNFRGQLNCFVQDFGKALTQQPQLAPEVNIDSLSQIFKQYFHTDLNVSLYGVCYIEDLFDGAKKKGFGNRESCKEAPKVDAKGISECIAFLQNLLLSVPSYSVPIDQLYKNNWSFFECRLNLSSRNYPQFVQSIASLSVGHFHFMSDGPKHYIALSLKRRQLELGKRLMEVYLLVSFVGDPHSTDCECAMAISIHDIFAYYLLSLDNTLERNTVYHTSICGTSSLLKFFEKTMIRMYKTQMYEHCCLIYKEEDDTFLRRCTADWMQEQAMMMLAILFESPSYSLDWQQLSQSFRRLSGYSLGPSCLYHAQFREVVTFELKQQLLIQISPLYEFAIRCLCVMLLHSKCEPTQKKWQISELESEYYDHFGIALPKPDSFGCDDLKQLFQRAHLLFDLIELPSQVLICLKTSQFLNFINCLSISTCNYCEKSPVLQRNQQPES